MRLLILFLVLRLSGLVTLADDAPKPVLVKEPALQTELLRRKSIDQETRNAVMHWMKNHGRDAAEKIAVRGKDEAAELQRLTIKLKEVDKDNTKWLRGVVEQYGWPTNTLVGKDGAKAAWLLVQHADADPNFQRRCLDLMSKLPKEDVSQSDVAYLTDRVLLAEGKKQRYGTQFRKIDDKWQPRPLEDEANVDNRRAEVGLPPLAEYIKLIEKQYGARTKND